jgi:hypothetical protein
VQFLLTLNRSEPVDPRKCWAAMSTIIRFTQPPRSPRSGAARDQRSAPHLLLRRLLGLRISRGRRQERAGLLEPNSPPSGLMHSRIYKGWVSIGASRRPANRFRYRMFMLYLDLAELPRCSTALPSGRRGGRARPGSSAAITLDPRRFRSTGGARPGPRAHRTRPTGPYACSRICVTSAIA